MQSINHILVIRLSAMGDVAISVPLLNAFRKQYPEVKITVLTKKLFAPMFKGIENCEVFVPDLKGKHKGVLGLFRLCKILKTNGVQAVVDLHGVLRTHILKVFFCLSGVPFFQINKGRAEKKALTRSKNKPLKPLKTSFERYADVFKKAGFPIAITTFEFAKKMDLPPMFSAVATDKFKIGIAPFAAHQGKMYCWEKMQNVIAEWSKTSAVIFLFGGGKTEKALLDEVAEKHENVINVAGRISFSEELQLISNLDVMLAMDSGNAHLAAMYGVPTVTVWGVTHPFAGFYPYAQPLENALLADREKYPEIPTSVYGNRYPKGYENAINSVTENEISTKIKTILKIK